jgi:tRNA(Ile)-lysidine synthase
MIKEFLDEHLDVSKPLLLALSGGADSKALLHLLLEFQAQKPFELHIAHIDHGWRKESSIEASELKILAGFHGIAFHLEVLNEMPPNNLEEFFRIKRYEFFEKLQDQFGFQAVVLGHHQDDLVETILKRLFEGASFKNILAMDFISKKGSLTLWRPLLGIKKNNLLDFIQKQELTYFDDYTNQDNTYLRSRTRQVILPFINKTFGKEISKPLLRLAKDLKEVDSYLDLKTSDIWQLRLCGPFGIALDLSLVSHDVERKHLFRKMAFSQNFSYTRSVEEFLIQALNKKKTDSYFEFKGGYFVVDRGFVFLVTHKAELNNWVVEKSQIKQSSNWKDVWLGKVSIPLYKSFTLKKACSNDLLFNKTSLDKWWQQHKVPAFLRSFVPSIVVEDKLVFEMLSGVKFQQQEGVELESANLIYIAKHRFTNQKHVF